MALVGGLRWFVIKAGLGCCGGGRRDGSCQVGVDRGGDGVRRLRGLLWLLLVAFLHFALLVLGLLLLGDGVAVEAEGLGAQLLVRVLGGGGGQGASLGLGFRLGETFFGGLLLGLCLQVGVANLLMGSGLRGKGIGGVLIRTCARGDGGDGLIGGHGDAGSLAGDGATDGGALGGLGGSGGESLLRRFAVADLFAMDLLGFVDGLDRLAVLLVYLGGGGGFLFGDALAGGGEFSLGTVGLFLLEALLGLDLLLERRRLVGGIGDLGGGLLGGGAGIDEDRERSRCRRRRGPW